MTIGAVIRVKDDLELLLQNLAYHASVGVDYFVVCANGSSEKSRARLERLEEQADNVHVFGLDFYRSPNVDRETMKRVRLATFERMVDVFSPDWIFVPDTDELWVPRNGDLETAVRASGVDHLDVARYNAALLRGAGPRLCERMLTVGEVSRQEIIVKPTLLSAEVMETKPAVPWVFHQLPSKFMTSVRQVAEIMPGFHDLRARGSFRRHRPENLLILHLPFTTLERFARKVEDMRYHLEHVGHTFSAGQAWSWKRWVQKITDVESLRAEFDKQFFSSGELIDLRRRGIVMKIQDYLASFAGMAAGSRAESTDSIPS